MKYFLALFFCYSLSFLQATNESEEWVLATLREQNDGLQMPLCGTFVADVFWKVDITRLGKNQESITITIRCPRELAIGWKHGNIYRMCIKRNPPPVISLFDKWTYTLVDVILVSENPEC